MAKTGFRCWHPDGGATEDHARHIEAMDSEEAAELFAEHDDNDSAEYPDTQTVAVRDVATGEMSVWLVRGDWSRSYYAYQQPASTVESAERGPDAGGVG